MKVMNYNEITGIWIFDFLIPAENQTVFKIREMILL